MNDPFYSQRKMSYACDLCNRIFKYPSILKLHYQSHTGEKPFRCEFCLKIFSHEAHLIVHEQIHAQKSKYACEICNASFLQKSALEEHNKLHKDGREDNEFAKESFSCENGLDYQNVTLKEKKQHECVICTEVKAWVQESFRSENGLVHQNVTLEKGAICSKVLPKQCDLNCHFPELKEEEPVLSNKIYDETLSKKSRISHRYSIREKPRIFICDRCGESFSKEENFKIHNCDHTHKEDELFEKLFSREDKINLHHQVNTNERRFMCNICGKLFCRKDHLIVHNRIHTNERPFMCNTCGKLFNRKDNLKIHNRIHTNERPFMCNTCGKLFSRKDKLKSHYRVHSRTEPLYALNAVKHLRVLRT